MQQDTGRIVQDGRTPALSLGAWVAFALALCFFSGVFYRAPEAWRFLGALDFTTLLGRFGEMGGATFAGRGGAGARQGFLYAVTLFPGVMAAMGILAVLAHYGALNVAQFLLTPLFEPLLGVSGRCGLALMTSLQSTDAGAALTRQLYEEGSIGLKGLVVLSAWQYAGSALVAIYFSIVSALFPAFIVPVWVPLCLIFGLKFLGGALVRLALSTLYRADFS
jgi:nucleoside recognition membrane protein YjiH